MPVHGERDRQRILYHTSTSFRKVTHWYLFSILYRACYGYDIRSARRPRKTKPVMVFCRKDNSFHPLAATKGFHPLLAVQFNRIETWRDQNLHNPIHGHWKYSVRNARKHKFPFSASPPAFLGNRKNRLRSVHHRGASIQQCDSSPQA